MKQKLILNQLLFILVSLSFLYLIHSNNLYIFFGFISYHDYYIDWEFIKSFAKCALENKNRYLDGTCDILNRRAVYPPIWSYVPKFILYIKNEIIFFLNVFFLFFTISKFLITDKSKENLFVFLIIFSPYFLYAYHRLNVEIFILILTFYSIYYIHNNHLIKKFFGQFLIIFITALKIYPGILFLFFVNLKRKNKIILFSFASILFLYFFIFHLHDFKIMFENKDMAGLPGHGSFSGNNIYIFLFKIFSIKVPYHSLIYTFCNMLIILIIFLMLKRNNKPYSLRHSLDEKFWLAGFLIIIFSFVVSYNINYRFIFILLFLPLFFNKKFNVCSNNRFDKKLFLSIFILKYLVQIFLTYIVIYMYKYQVNLTFFTSDKFGLAYNFFDSLLQWVLIIILIKIFKSNSLYKIIQ